MRVGDHKARRSSRGREPVEEMRLGDHKARRTSLGREPVEEIGTLPRLPQCLLFTVGA
jgi:hypothetical protein